MALDRGYVTREEFDGLSTLATETARLIAGTMRYLKRFPFGGKKFTRSTDGRGAPGLES